MLAQRQAIKILGMVAVDLVEERFVGYRENLVRRLKAIIDAQARFDTDAKRQPEVLAEIAALAAILTSKRGQK